MLYGNVFNFSAIVKDGVSVSPQTTFIGLQVKREPYLFCPNYGSCNTKGLLIC